MPLLRPPTGEAVYRRVCDAVLRRHKAGWTTRRIVLRPPDYRALMRHLRSIGAIPPGAEAMPLRRWADPAGGLIDVSVGPRFAVTD